MRTLSLICPGERDCGQTRPEKFTRRGHGFIPAVIENVPSRSSFPFLIPHENSSDCMRCDISIPTARKFLYKRRND